MRKAKKEKERKISDRGEANGERERGEKKILTFSRRSDYRSLTIREEKLIHASQVMHGYQNLRVS